MSEPITFNDRPIASPSDDRFGMDLFAKSLASSIRKISSPEGTVIALNGHWGSGKSSAINLVLYHLRESISSNEIGIINFACWWFRGEEALALAFFRELYAGLGPTLGDQFKKALPKLGARLLRAGSMIGPGIDLIGAGGVGAVAAGAMNWLSGLIEQDDTVEKLHAELTKELAAKNKRFLIVIDDIDRLTPDEALLIFRLVKSVGRLPNVIYLLAFDRQLAEKFVKERYPSEGPHYLEKIIQAGFDVPEPRRADLCQQLLESVGTVCGSPPESRLVQFMNIFYDVVTPEIKTPRDLVRLMNALSVTWPAVRNEVDEGDFVGLETLRVFQPETYRALRSNKELLCGMGDRGPKQNPDEYDRRFLGKVGGPDLPRSRRALMRLFPRLESIWGNTHYGKTSVDAWARQRRVCSVAHFDAYFRFSLSDEILPKVEIDELITSAANEAFVAKSFREALAVRRSDGATKASLLLDELRLHADEIADESVQPLLNAIFKLGDELDVEADVAKGFSFGDNQLRIRWLLQNLIFDRFDLNKRSEILSTASRTAALGWYIYFAESAYADYHPRDGKDPEPAQNCLVTADDAENLHKTELARIRAAAKSGELGRHRKLPYLLYRWRDLAADDGAEVGQWTDEQLNSDRMVVCFAKAFTTYSWSQALGFGGISDAVSRRITDANVDRLEMIMDKDRFRSRVEELASKEDLANADAEIIRTFLDAWLRHDKNPRD